MGRRDRTVDPATSTMADLQARAEAAERDAASARATLEELRQHARAEAMAHAVELGHARAEAALANERAARTELALAPMLAERQRISDHVCRLHFPDPATGLCYEDGKPVPCPTSSVLVA